MTYLEGVKKVWLISYHVHLVLGQKILMYNFYTTYVQILIMYIIIIKGCKIVD